MHVVSVRHQDQDPHGHVGPAYLFTSFLLCFFFPPTWPSIPSFTSSRGEELSGLQAVNKSDICGSQADRAGQGCGSTLFGLVSTLYLKPLLIRS